jgi:hypothetical protein
MAMDKSAHAAGAAKRGTGAAKRGTIAAKSPGLVALFAAPAARALLSVADPDSLHQSR